MCWDTNREKYTVKKIAEQDIPVFKVVKYYKEIGTIYSYFFNFKYEIGKMYFESKPLCPIEWKMGIGLGIGHYTIDGGFHSYNEHCSYGVIYSRPFGEECIYIVGINPKYRISQKSAIMHCVIPADAEYYENERGEIVSNMLKPISIEEI